MISGEIERLEARVTKLEKALRLHTRNANQHHPQCEKLIRGPNVEAKCTCGVAALAAPRRGKAMTEQNGARK